MKIIKFVCFMIMMGISQTSYGYQANADYTAIDGIIASIYDTVSGPAGDRDWYYHASLYAEGAIMIPTNGKGKYRFYTPEVYRECNTDFFKKWLP